MTPTQIAVLVVMLALAAVVVSRPAGESFSLFKRKKRGQSVTSSPSPPSVSSPGSSGPVTAMGPARIFAPYLPSWVTLDVGGLPCTTVTFCFLLADPSGKPSFDGTQPLSQFVPQANAIRRRGGDFRISAGGASGTELASAIKSVDALAAAYEQAIVMYNLNRLDLDIEGAAIADTATNDRRFQAIAKLQAKYPRFQVDLTLPSMPDGLTADGVKVLAQAKLRGVRVGAVSPMFFDFGEQYNGKMAGYAIAGAKSVRAQVLAAGLSCGVGIVSMLGKNDTEGEIFRQDDATAIVQFAKATPWVTLLSFWSLERDDGTTAGIPAQKFDFTRIFSQFAP